MRHAMIAVLSSMLLAAPALAQDQPAAPSAARPAADRIVFDIDQNATDAGEWDFGIARTSQQSTMPPPVCSSDSDIIQAQSTGPQRYDDNGAPIRAAASCSLDRPRASVAQTTASTTASRSEFLREPACEESATGYACASSGALGNATYEREAQCRETATGRACSSSFSVGNSEEGRNLANDVLERMARD
jgi:hypothetical protein